MGPNPVTASMRRRFEPIEPSRHDLDRADVAERAHVGAAAQLGRVRAGLEHAHDVAVLVAEERDGAELLGVVLRGLVVADRDVGEDVVRSTRSSISADLLGRDRLVVAEVEAQPVGRHERALLLHVVAEHLAQRPVQEVGGGVVAADGVAARRRRSRRSTSWPGVDLALDDARHVAVQAGQRRTAVSSTSARAGVGRDRAGVADLAAGLGVERRAVEDDARPVVAGSATTASDASLASRTPRGR